MSFDAFDISASGLYAQRVRMDTVASNIANVNTTRNADGTVGAYRRKQTIFQAVYDNAVGTAGNSANNITGNKTNSFNVGGSSPGMSCISSSGNLLKAGISMNAPEISTGVTVSQIAEDVNTPLKKMYNPSHPDADKNGFVEMPNVNIVTEMVDMISASRAYEANVTTIDTTKNMLAAAIKI